MDGLKLYSVTNEYINYLRQFEPKVFSNKEDTASQSRKYLGVVFKIGNFKYFVPLSSPKDSDYILIGGKRQIRKSIIPIIRIITKDSNGNDELKGTLKFSNMISVPDCELLNYDIGHEPASNYKILVLKEWDFISSNRNLILKHAKIIYNQKIKNFNIRYLKNTVNFLLVEQKCKEYESMQQAAASEAEDMPQGTTEN